MSAENHTSSFAAARLNASTFVITEDDSYGEKPLMYAKIYDDPPALLLSDTGCNSPSENSKNAQFIRLRDFLEHYPIPDLGEPINPDGRRAYVVIATHCHYDHIGGISQFRSTENNNQQADVVASNDGAPFVLEDLWEHSLYKDLGLPEPDYRPSIWAQHKSQLFFDQGSVHAVPHDEIDRVKALGYHDLDITILNTPGHTPDELAWYDRKERHLFVGDSMYYTGGQGPFPGTFAGPIILPKEADLVAYMRSMREMLQFVVQENACGEAGSERKLRVGCGHVNSDEDAFEMLDNIIDFLEAILEHKIPISKRQTIRGEENWSFVSEVMGREVGLRAPARLFEEYETRNRPKHTQQAGTWH
ncbi:hypothetical protein K461DRAFT_329994 [Myriangium duriaei CBS 260.36]|uniref:Metallo-beta-lactamase domain-containing protein n=1 Tax=Myriangium duriaei CBS 260.36 TaxID=1168546 RepID=A0A9P4IR23_9PEZI|nr:hypothetical protein K461DRAFT_329994 [Myriangium duriaei CBS 260.36]